MRGDHVSMKKLQSIFAVVEDPVSGALVLDKAVLLARHYRARVDLLVADSLLTGEFASRCAALGYDEVNLCSLFRSGEPLHVLLLRRIHERNPDLVVKAPFGEHPLLHWTLDEKEQALASGCAVPILLISARPWQISPRFAAAVDVSDTQSVATARSILQSAGFLAHGCHGSLDILYSEREALDETVRMERAVRLAQLVREFHVGCERLQMFGGAPELRLPRLVAARKYDVLVLGTVSEGEGGLLASAVPGDQPDASDSDVVLVKSMQPERPARPSVHDKAAYHREQFL
jgi:hypothetical protein